MRPGCYEQAARLADMDENHTEASLCFPTFPRFCGQTFLERGDTELALACVQAYNDWMIDEWCAGAGRGRLIPLTLIPLWDPELAAAEVRRCAAKGSFAVALLARIRRGSTCRASTPTHWDPFFAGVRGDRHRRQHAHRVVVDVPADVARRARPRVAHAHLRGRDPRPRRLADRGRAGPVPPLRIALSEGQVGWMPFVARTPRRRGAPPARLRRRSATGWPNPPSTYVPGRVFGCIFDDLDGLALRDVDRDGARSCSRPTTRTATRRGRTRRRSSRSWWPRPGWTTARPTPCCGATPSAATGSTASASRPRGPCSTSSSGAATSSTAPAPRRVADVGVDGGRIVAIGTGDDAPPHHRRRRADRRARLRRRPHAPRRPGVLGPNLSPSPLHGVTTVLVGQLRVHHRPAHRGGGPTT